MYTRERELIQLVESQLDVVPTEVVEWRAGQESVVTTMSIAHGPENIPRRKGTRYHPHKPLTLSHKFKRSEEINSVPLIERPMVFVRSREEDKGILRSVRRL